MSMVAPQPVRQKQRSERGTSAEKKHFAFLHELTCVLSGQFGIEAAHLRSPCAAFAKPLAGVSAKPHFIWTLPLSPELHREQHSMGEQAFWASYGMPLDGPMTETPFMLALALAGFSHTGDAYDANRFIAEQISGRLFNGGPIREDTAR